MIEEFQARLCYSCKHGTKPVAPESIKAKALQQDQKVVSAKGQTPAQTEPEWVEDGDVAQCASCNDSFSLFNRKHHCRGGMHISTAVATELQWKTAGCGHIFCDDCSLHRIQTLPWAWDVTSRVCNSCYTEFSTCGPESNLAGSDASTAKINGLGRSTLKVQTIIPVDKGSSTVGASRSMGHPLHADAFLESKLFDWVFFEAFGRADIEGNGIISIKVDLRTLAEFIIHVGNNSS